MMKLMKKQLSNQRGVTLIELLAVIVILGILAAVAVPAVMGQIGDSKTKVDEANAEMIADAIERAYIVGDLSSISIPLSETKLVGSDLETALVTKYLKEIPSTETGDDFYVTITKVGTSDSINVSVVVK